MSSIAVISYRVQNIEPRPIDIHGGSVKSLVFLVDGKHIVGGCMDGSIRLWRMDDGLELASPMASGGMVRSIAISPDGKWIVSGGDDCKVTIWGAISHKKTGESAEQYPTGVTTLDIAPDSSCVAAGSEDGVVLVWCLEGGQRIAGPLRHQDSQISSIKFCPTADRFASACTGWDSDSIRIWHSHTGDQIACLSTDNKPAYSLAWAQDGRRLFAGGPRGSIKCFDIASRSIVLVFGDQICDSITSLCISNNGRFLVAGSMSGCSLSFWDVNALERIGFSLYPRGEVVTVANSPDDHHIVVGTSNKRISIWSLSDIVPVTYFFHVSISLCSALSGD